LKLFLLLVKALGGAVLLLMLSLARVRFVLVRLGALLLLLMPLPTPRLMLLMPIVLLLLAMRLLLLITTMFSCAKLLSLLVHLQTLMPLLLVVWVPLRIETQTPNP
jgi:hypothetical protein